MQFLPLPLIFQPQQAAHFAEAKISLFARRFMNFYKRFFSPLFVMHLE